MIMKTIRTKSFELAVYTRGDENAGKVALVLPGRLDTKDYIHMTSHVDFLADRGYYPLSFDVPGTWESPGDITEYTTTNYIRVVNELIERLGNKPTLLIGHSRGGSVAILAGAANKNVIGIIPIMATYGAPSSPSPEDLKAGVHVSHRDLPPGTSKTAEQREFALPLSYFTDGRQYNPATKLREFAGPKLLICATNDEFTPPEKAKGVFDTLTEPKMLLELNTGHDYRYHPEMIEKVNSAIGKFIQNYLAA